MTRTGVRELVLGGHGRRHGADEVYCPLDIYIDRLGEDVELQVWRDSTGDVSQLQDVNLPLDGRVRTRDVKTPDEKWYYLLRHC